MLARLAPIAFLLAACSDDAGWSRDELPANARVELQVMGSSPAPCMPWGITTVRVSGLDTASPTAVTVTSNGPCAWDGDAISCTFTAGQAGTMRIDFAAMLARLEVPGGVTCSTEYAITAIAAIP